MDVLLGTSGWSYTDWEGPFYPKGEKKKLTYYAKFFDTVEIDSTFYAYPKKGFALGLSINTPPGFVFSAKVPKLITHEKALDPSSGVKEDLFRFLHLLKPLVEKGKLGPLLIQLPPSFQYAEGVDRLEAFLDFVPEGVSFAVEFRNRSWLGKERALRILADHNVAITLVDEPLLPAETTSTADFAFVRWHGRGSRPWYNYRYKQEELEEWKDRVQEVASKTRKVYGYFNNHFHGYAIENTLQMMDILGSSDAEHRKLLASVSAKLDSGFRKEQATLA